MRLLSANIGVFSLLNRAPADAGGSDMKWPPAYAGGSDMKWLPADAVGSDMIGGTERTRTVIVFVDSEVHKPFCHGPELGGSIGFESTTASFTVRCSAS